MILGLAVTLLCYGLVMAITINSKGVDCLVHSGGRFQANCKPLSVRSVLVAVLRYEFRHFSAQKV